MRLGVVLLLGSAVVATAATPVTGQVAGKLPGVRRPDTMPAPASRPRPASVYGLVRDTAGNPLPYATVVWGEARQVISTTDSGSFKLVDISSGKVRFTVRRLGFVPVDFEVMLKPGTIKPLVVRLTPVPSPLSEVSVAAHENVDSDSMRAQRFRVTGFFDRMSNLPGYFIPPAEVERRQPTAISDLMNGVPGVIAIGRAHTSSLRYIAGGKYCRLQLYLDGHPVADGDDMVPGTDIKAIEVYTSLLGTAQRFLPSPLKGYCGSVVVWTK